MYQIQTLPCRIENVVESSVDHPSFTSECWRNCEKLLHLASEAIKHLCRNILLLSTPSTPLRPPQGHTEQPTADHSLSLPPGHFLFQRHGRPSLQIAKRIPSPGCVFRGIPPAPCCTVHWLSHPRVRGPDIILHGRRASWSRMMEGGRASDVDFHFTRLANAPPIDAMGHQIRQSLMHAPPSRSASRSLAQWDVSVERLGVSIN